MQLGSTETRYSGNFTYIKDTIEATHLETYGEYKQKEINLLSNVLSSNEGQTVVYDVGAGIGIHAMAFSKLANVVAFEADEDQYKVLDMNTKGKLAPHVLAVKGTLETDNVEDPNIPNFDHQMMKLPEPTLVRISGDSTKVLNGMRTTLIVIKPVIFIDIQNTRDISYQYGILKENQYKLYWYSCVDFNENNYNKNQVNITNNSFHMNILAIHSGVDIADGELGLPKIDGPLDNWKRFMND
tara:strand:- start:1145 stop:1867 length:723 start_codon:yes stop_codon:yes gene_type:complete